MFCGNCGAHINEGDKFCSSCGAQQNNGFIMSFHAKGCFPWSINNDSIIIDNKGVIRFEDITSVKLNTTTSSFLNGVITVVAFSQSYILAFPYSQKSEGEQAYELLMAKYGSEYRRNQYKNEMAAESMEIVYNVQGVRGRSLKIFPDRAIIKVTAGFGSLITGNVSDGEKVIYFADCVGLQFKESGFQIGYLQFETAAHTMNQSANNFFNENSFTFDLSVTTNELMKEIRDYVQGQIRLCKSAPAGNVQYTPSPADELKKFKELLDMGIITQEEFDMKKKQILGF